MTLVNLPMARLPNGILVPKTRAISPVAKVFIDCAPRSQSPSQSKSDHAAALALLHTWIGQSLGSNDGDALNFDHQARHSETRYCNQRACWKALFENLFANFGELVAIARVRDEHRHGHYVC